MGTDADKLAERLLDFAVAVVKQANALPNSITGRHFGGQLLRAGTSAAANYEEACAAENRADFVHKMHITLKELRESRFWLRIMIRASITRDHECETLLKEANELCNIIGRSVVTAKSSKQPGVKG